MDWAMLLAMPLMLLVGMIGDGISRDDDEGAESPDAESEGSGAAATEEGATMGDLLSEPAPVKAHPAAPTSATPHDDVIAGFRAALASLEADEAAALSSEASAGAVAGDGSDDTAEDGRSDEGDMAAPGEKPRAQIDTAATPAGAEAEADGGADATGEATEEQAALAGAGQGEERAGEAEPSPREVIENFDPEEDVLVFDAPGNATEMPEMTLTDEGVLVRMAEREVLLAGLSELPGAEAVFTVR